MTKTSHKKNRPIDFKLISLVEQHPVIYLRQIAGMSSFEIMKAKNKVWQEIADQMGYPVQFCINRWNNLRGNYQKEVRQSRELCPMTGVIRGSTWPYLERLKFLECTLQSNKPKKEKRPKRKVQELDTIQESDNWEDSNESHLMSPKTELEHELQMDLTPVQENIPMEEYYDETFSIIEEIAEEVVGTENCVIVEDTKDDICRKDSYTVLEEIVEDVVETEEVHTIEDSKDSLRKIEKLLSGFDGETRQHIDRRLLAFLCKCQLRSLCYQSIDDLFV